MEGNHENLIFNKADKIITKFPIDKKNLSQKNF